MQSLAAEASLDWKKVRGRFRRRSGDVDGRSSTSRRVAKLAASFVSEIEPSAVTPTVMLKVRRAAELMVAAEELRASTLRGERQSDVALLSLVRLEGLADRAVRRLHLDRKRESGVPDLKSYLASLPPSREPTT